MGQMWAECGLEIFTYLWKPCDRGRPTDAQPLREEQGGSVAQSGQADDRNDLQTTSSPHLPHPTPLNSPPTCRRVLEVRSVGGHRKLV